ncbi:hypothetical protein [uncultured Bifidobacterium sp.]|uniref:hypothetical protein n=1 Tax=uncultured Bifidobacterium sp. TaxID=165187 RepID=UPI00258FFBFC|nr:hypothetical protein [uncultured Bifidobacterium sp.]MEE0653842.1 hypothetical protein [Bifidobacterium criceti]
MSEPNQDTPQTRTGYETATQAGVNNDAQKAAEERGNTAHDAAPTPLESKDKSAADIPESEVSQAILETDMPVEGHPNELAYGAMDNQFPKDYDPYLFGRPENGETHEQVERDARDEENRIEQRRAQRRAGNPMNMPVMGYGRQMGASGMPGMGQNVDPNAPFGDRRNYGADNRKLPRYVQGIDLDDPNQNVYYGRWDTSSIIAFVLSILLPVPFLPALLGSFGMYRTKLMRMKGFGFALAAVIINIVYSIAVIWMMINGVSTQEMLNDVLHMLGLNGSVGGTDGSSATPTPTATPSDTATPTPTGSASNNDGVTSAMGI